MEQNHSKLISKKSIFSKLGEVNYFSGRDVSKPIPNISPDIQGFTKNQTFTELLKSSTELKLRPLTHTVNFITFGTPVDYFSGRDLPSVRPSPDIVGFTKNQTFTELLKSSTELKLRPLMHSVLGISLGTPVDYFSGRDFDLPRPQQQSNDISGFTKNQKITELLSGTLPTLKLYSLMSYVNGEAIGHPVDYFSGRDFDLPNTRIPKNTDIAGFTINQTASNFYKHTDNNPKTLDLVLRPLLFNPYFKLGITQSSLENQLNFTWKSKIGSPLFLHTGFSDDSKYSSGTSNLLTKLGIYDTSTKDINKNFDSSYDNLDTVNFFSGRDFNLPRILINPDIEGFTSRKTHTEFLKGNIGINSWNPTGLILDSYMLTVSWKNKAITLSDQLKFNNVTSLFDHSGFNITSKYASQTGMVLSQDGLYNGDIAFGRSVKGVYGTNAFEPFKTYTTSQDVNTLTYTSTSATDTINNFVFDTLKFKSTNYGNIVTDSKGTFGLGIGFAKGVQTSYSSYNVNPPYGTEIKSLNDYYSMADNANYKLSYYNNISEKLSFGAGNIITEPFVIGLINDGTDADWYDRGAHSTLFRSGIVNTIKRTAKDVYRIGSFFASSRGIQFIIKQAGLQAMSPRPETNIISGGTLLEGIAGAVSIPINILASVALAGIGIHPTRHSILGDTPKTYLDSADIKGVNGKQFGGQKTNRLTFMWVNNMLNDIDKHITNNFIIGRGVSKNAQTLNDVYGVSLNQHSIYGIRALASWPSDFGYKRVVPSDIDISKNIIKSTPRYKYDYIYSVFPEPLHEKNISHGEVKYSNHYGMYINNKNDLKYNTSTYVTLPLYNMVTEFTKTSNLLDTIRETADRNDRIKKLAKGVESNYQYTFKSHSEYMKIEDNVKHSNITEQTDDMVDSLQSSGSITLKKIDDKRTTTGRDNRIKKLANIIPDRGQYTFKSHTDYMGIQDTDKHFNKRNEKIGDTFKTNVENYRWYSDDLHDKSKSYGHHEYPYNDKYTKYTTFKDIKFPKYDENKYLSNTEKFNRFNDNTNLDLVKLTFSGGGKSIEFSAIVDTYTDAYSPNYNTVNYIGNPIGYPIYQNTKRTINLGFKVAAYNSSDLSKIKDKLKNLSNMTWPANVSGALNRISTPFIIFGFGKFINGERGVITTLQYSIDTATPWGGERDISDPIHPMVVSVSATLDIVPKTVPNAYTYDENIVTTNQQIEEKAYAKGAEFVQAQIDAANKIKQEEDEKEKKKKEEDAKNKKEEDAKKKTLLNKDVENIKGQLLMSKLKL